MHQFWQLPQTLLQGVLRGESFSNEIGVCSIHFNCHSAHSPNHFRAIIGCDVSAAMVGLIFRSHSFRCQHRHHRVRHSIRSHQALPTTWRSRTDDFRWLLCGSGGVHSYYNFSCGEFQYPWWFVGGFALGRVAHMADALSGTLFSASLRRIAAATYTMQNQRSARCRHEPHVLPLLRWSLLESKRPRLWFDVRPLACFELEPALGMCNRCAAVQGRQFKGALLCMTL